MRTKDQGPRTKDRGLRTDDSRRITVACVGATRWVARAANCTESVRIVTPLGKGEQVWQQRLKCRERVLNTTG